MNAYKDMLKYMIPYIKATGSIGKELTKYKDAVRYCKALYEMSQSAPNVEKANEFLMTYREVKDGLYEIEEELVEAVKGAVIDMMASSLTDMIIDDYK